MEGDAVIESRKAKVAAWLKNNYLLVAVMFFAVALRFYYFWITKNQPLWWDEASYMAVSKYYAGQGFYQLESIRLPFFPMLMSVFFFLGISQEPLMRFIGLFIPSVLVIFLAYFILSRMYNKKTGIISALILAVLWEHAFYSNRFHTENLALIFEFLAVYLMLNLWKNVKSWKPSRIILQIIYLLALCGLSVLSRPGNIIFVPAVLGFLVLCGIFSMNISDRGKNFAVIGFIIAVPIAFFLLTLLIPAISFLSGYYHPDWPMGWKSLTVFNGFYLANSFPAAIFLAAFFIGVIAALFNIFLSYGHFKRMFMESREFSSDIFNLLIVFSVLFAMVFMLRASSFEYRWFFPLLPGMLAFTSNGIVSFSRYAEKLSKIKFISVFIIAVILVLGAYPQVIHATDIIKLKVDSYSQVRDSGIWIKENSGVNDIILSDSVPQHSYYSERKVMNFNQTEEDFEKFLLEVHPRYAVISVFENYPQWVYEWPQTSSEITPVNAFYDSQKNPLLVIYEFTSLENSS